MREDSNQGMIKYVCFLVDYTAFFTCITIFDNLYLRNNSWKPEFVYSFNMGNIIFINILSRVIARDKMTASTIEHDLKTLSEFFFFSHKKISTDNFRNYFSNVYTEISDLNFIIRVLYI
jgi:hypothetical protein